MKVRRCQLDIAQGGHLKTYSSSLVVLVYLKTAFIYWRQKVCARFSTTPRVRYIPAANIYAFVAGGTALPNKASVPLCPGQTSCNCHQYRLHKVGASGIGSNSARRLVHQGILC